MYKIKTLLVVSAILIVSVLSGCSDEISSPVTESIIASDKMTIPVIRNIKLHPHEEVVIDKNNTGFEKISSLIISDCESVSDKIRLTGYDNDSMFPLGCFNDGFLFSSFSIENISSGEIKIEFIVSGKNTDRKVKQNFE